MEIICWWQPPGACQCPKPGDYIIAGRSESIWSNTISSRTVSLNYSLRGALAEQFFLLKYRLTPLPENIQTFWKIKTTHSINQTYVSYVYHLFCHWEAKSIICYSLLAPRYEKYTTPSWKPFTLFSLRHLKYIIQSKRQQLLK